MMNKIPYYTYIPPQVRYDDRLTANAKLLCGDIFTVCMMEGVCTITNAEFGGLYNVSAKSVENWIASLVKCGYLTSDVIRDEKQIVLRRELRICGSEGK